MIFPREVLVRREEMEISLGKFGVVGRRRELPRQSLSNMSRQHLELAHVWSESLHFAESVMTSCLTLDSNASDNIDETHTHHASGAI